MGRLPRVARSSQPWAGGLNPVGIAKTKIGASGLASSVRISANAALSANAKFVLKRIKTPVRGATGGHFAIVASSYNKRYVDGMVRAAEKCLRAARVATLKVVRVPGAYEIPVAAARLAERHAPPLDAILCLGVILRGATTHAQHIGEAVTNALTQIQLQHGIPVIHEVLLFENKEQAEVRCLSRDHNRGAEAAQTALEMARVMRELD